MPRIDDDLQVTPKRPFKKKAYRPWNLMDDDFAVAPKAEQQNEKTILTAMIPAVTESLEATQEKTAVPEPSRVPIEVVSDMVTKRESIGNHMVINMGPISNQIDTDEPPLVTIQKPIGKRISNPISKQVSSQTQTGRPDYYAGLSVTDLIKRVTGIQLKILFRIVEDCILNGSLSSSPITNESLQLLTNANRDTVKTAIQRLFNKKLLFRGFGKPGRGGFAIYDITDEIRNAVIDVQKRTNSHNGMVTNWVANRESNNPYSSGSNNKNTTTKENNNFSDIPSQWDSIDLEPLHNIGFQKSHLKQIIMDDKLPSDIVQDSIYAFAFDLDKNNKIKTLKSAPLNYFMGILRSGKPYAPPANYESPQDAAMRLYLERKKEAEQKRLAMEDELFSMSFNEWEASLSAESKDLIYPQNIRNSRHTSEKLAHLRIHFREQIWASKREEYLQN